MAKGLLLQSKSGENGQKNNVKESIVPVFYIIIYRVSSQYMMLMKNISRSFKTQSSCPCLPKPSLLGSKRKGVKSGLYRLSTSHLYLIYNNR